MRHLQDGLSEALAAGALRVDQDAVAIEYQVREGWSATRRAGSCSYSCAL